MLPCFVCVAQTERGCFVDNDKRYVQSPCRLQRFEAGSGWAEASRHVRQLRTIVSSVSFASGSVNEWHWARLWNSFGHRNMLLLDGAP